MNEFYDFADTNKCKLIKGVEFVEYNIDFQDRISRYEFEGKAKQIADWIEANKNLYDWAKDPNAYEMVNVFLFAGKYASEGKNVDTKDVERIWNLRSGDFEGCGISENHFVYQICKQSYEAAISGHALVEDEKSHHALRKMAGIGLYVMQQKRDHMITYNNFNELEELMEDTKVLKQNYPELHETLKFGSNIKALYKLQKLNLNDEISIKRLEDLYQEYQKVPVGKVLQQGSYMER